MPLILGVVCSCTSGPADSEIGCRDSYIPEARSLFSDDRYSRIDQVSEIPEPVQEAVLDELRWTEHLWADIEEVIANPGECYNPTDVVSTGIPNRRLILGGVSEERVFLYYEHGGYVPHTDLAVFEVKRNKALIILIDNDAPHDFKTLDPEQKVTPTGHDTETSVNRANWANGHL